jgi:hypothetical protein
MFKMINISATILVYCLFISSSSFISASLDEEEAAEAEVRLMCNTTINKAGYFALNSDLIALQAQINGIFCAHYI